MLVALEHKHTLSSLLTEPTFAGGLCACVCMCVHVCVHVYVRVCDYTSLSDKFSSSLNAISCEMTSLKTQVSASQLNKVPHNLKDTTTATVTQTNTPSKIGRSANVIFFGIPEQDILNTRSKHVCIWLVRVSLSKIYIDLVGDRVLILIRMLTIQDLFL